MFWCVLERKKKRGRTVAGNLLVLTPTLGLNDYLLTDMEETHSVLFLCLGNIVRSTMSEIGAFFGDALATLQFLRTTSLYAYR